MMGYGGYQAPAATNNSTQGYQATSGTGGGFVSPNPFGSQGASPSTKTRGGSQNQSLRAITIKQLVDATQAFPDAPFMVDDKELNQVILIGRINKVVINSNNTVYSVDDGTGSIDVRKYTDADQDEDSIAPDVPRDGTYIKVIGQLKSFHSKKSIGAFKVMPIDSIDEITHHYLSVIHTHYALTKPLPKAMKSDPNSNGFAQSAYAMPQSFGFGENQFNPLQQQILSLLQQYGHSAEGGDIHDIFHRLRGAATENEIKDTIENLSADGHLYNTIDDYHYKLTGQ
ncbi:hypothetical protein BC833DRAFT_591558 [Globomyces pollinis-pini]|nr:hypothetical protein BC833DRAFT_591558 [Globomyces pollinis-pini]KAJ3000235.1 replication factor A protein 2 [Globomyces sp. JEL0801]